MHYNAVTSKDFVLNMTPTQESWVLMDIFPEPSVFIFKMCKTVAIYSDFSNFYICYSLIVYMSV